MSASLISELQPKIDAAFRAACWEVIARARQAGHGILTWRDGRVTEISCDEAEYQLRAAEARARNDHP